MSAYLGSQPQLEELLSYFSSYLKDITRTVVQVKTLVYSLINVAPPTPKHQLDINPDPATIMSACKRSLDDMKRIESVLKGHLKSK